MLGCPPSQDSSHHQDYYAFRLGDPELNIHLPLESWEGGQPKVYGLQRSVEVIFKGRLDGTKRGRPEGPVRVRILTVFSWCST